MLKCARGFADIIQHLLYVVLLFSQISEFNCLGALSVLSYKPDRLLLYLSCKYCTKMTKFGHRHSFSLSRGKGKRVEMRWESATAVNSRKKCKQRHSFPKDIMML